MSVYHPLQTWRKMISFKAFPFVRDVITVQQNLRSFCFPLDYFKIINKYFRIFYVIFKALQHQHLQQHYKSFINSLFFNTFQQRWKEFIHSVCVSCNSLKYSSSVLKFMHIIQIWYCTNRTENDTKKINSSTIETHKSFPIIRADGGREFQIIF